MTPGSEISLRVREGVYSTIIHKIYNDLDAAQCHIPSGSCVISPVISYQAIGDDNSDVKDVPKYTVTIPHCLPEELDLSLIKVRCGKSGNKGTLEEIPSKEEDCDNRPYYQAHGKTIKVYTDHFCPIVCTSEKKICDSSLVILPFGSLTHLSRNQTTVKVKVYVCNYLYNLMVNQRVCT